MVTSTMPANGGLDVPGNRPILVDFNTNVAPAIVNANTFVVRGDQQGPYPGTLTPAGNQVTFTPGINYRPSELITVDLTDGMMSIGAVSLTPYYFAINSFLHLQNPGDFEHGFRFFPKAVIGDKRWIENLTNELLRTAEPLIQDRSMHPFPASGKQVKNCGVSSIELDVRNQKMLSNELVIPFLHQVQM